MLSIDYYRKIKELFPKEVSKSRYIYIYTIDGVVQQVAFRFRKKNKYCLKRDVPKDVLLLSREQKKLPRNVIVQVCFAPLRFNLLEE